MLKRIFIFIVIAGLVTGTALFFLTREPKGYTENITWGVTYSKFYAEQAGLDWRKVYLEILNDLNPEIVRVPIYWQDVERESGKYDFSDYDWMIKRAEENEVKLVLVIGRKIPRWPECHVPDWASELPEDVQQSKALDLVGTIIERYKDAPNLYMWQVENEPFLDFGECPPADAIFLDKEIKKVRDIDSIHPILVTDSGEISIWLRAAKRGDVFGTTMYRIIWHDLLGYFKYPIPPKFFWVKANLLRIFHKDKPIIVCELQGEYWGHRHAYETDINEQMKEYSIEEFRGCLDYAEQVGFQEVYLWGAEWWYWLKEEHNNPAYWDEARKVIQDSSGK